MLPDSSWINALKLPTQVIIGLFLAFLVLLGLDWAAVLPLATFGELTKPIVIVLLVISGSLSITGIGAYIKDQWARRKSHLLVAMRRQLLARGECVLRYDNEVGKGDHQHFGGKESAYVFTTPEQLVADFENDIARWNHENRNP